MPASTLPRLGTYLYHVMQPLLPQLSNPNLVASDSQGPSNNSLQRPPSVNSGYRTGPVS